MVSDLLNVQFLNEPTYRWALFLIIVSLFWHAWTGVVAYMKA